MSGRARTRATLMAALLLLCTVACTGGVGDVMMDMASTWLRAHALELLAYNLIGTTGNAEVNAVLDARRVLEPLAEAERWMDDGRRLHDLGAMLRAVKRRPNDWGYRIWVGAEYLAQGNATEAAVHWQAADALKGTEPAEVRRYVALGIAELTAVEERLGGRYASGAQCRLLHTQLAALYRLRYTLTQLAGDEALAAQHDAAAGACAP